MTFLKKCILCNVVLTLTQIIIAVIIVKWYIIRIMNVCYVRLLLYCVQACIAGSKHLHVCNMMYVFIAFVHI